jgi:hypothetical protein
MKGLFRYGKVIRLGRDKVVCIDKEDMDYFFVPFYG